MSETQNTLFTKNTISINITLLSIFLTLKLFGISQVANWSWWWVTSPLWIPIALGAGILTLVLFVVIATYIFIITIVSYYRVIQIIIKLIKLNK
jgi:hypothetical protein